MKIIVYKSRRLLQILDGGKIILESQVHLGFGCNDGPKQKEGDGRTPEGQYFISSKNPESKFHLALGISYPNPTDARQAFSDGIIDEETLRAILENPKRPPWNTPMGGFVMLHGEHPEGKTGDWTAGCIAVPNSVMDKIFPLASVGDEIIINP